MKKVLCCLIAALVGVCLCACSNMSENEPYTVVAGEKTFTVDAANSVVSDGENEYRYAVSEGSGGYILTLTYPDGTSRVWAENAVSDTESEKAPAEDQYEDAAVLADVLRAAYPKSGWEKNAVKIIILLALGALHVIAPRKAWKWEYGRKMKDAEPTPAAMRLYRLGGAAAIIAAVILFFV